MALGNYTIPPYNDGEDRQSYNNLELEELYSVASCGGAPNGQRECSQVESTEAVEMGEMSDHVVLLTGASCNGYENLNMDRGALPPVPDEDLYEDPTVIFPRMNNICCSSKRRQLIMAVIIITLLSVIGTFIALYSRKGV